MKLQRGNIAERRVHVLKGQDWAKAAGTDFWLMNGPTGTYGATGDDLITNFGWTTTTVTVTQGTLADLLTSADVGTPNTLLISTASGLLQSPTIFGDYAHGLQASKFLGYFPTRLCMEAYAAFPASAAAETTTGFGFSTGTSLTATNHIGFIHSNATLFAIRGTPGTGGYIDTGAARDASYHLFKVVATAGGTVEWFIDGVSQGTITLVTDLFPTAFCASMVAAGANNVSIGPTHIWYE